MSKAHTSSRRPNSRTLVGIGGKEGFRQGLLVRDIENTYLELESTEASAMDDLFGHSISYRIVVGRHAGRNAFTLQTIPTQEDGKEDRKLAKASGFSLHAGIATQAHQRRKLERLCQYIVRLAVSTERMALTSQGNVRFALKTLYRGGTNHIILEPRASSPAWPLWCPSRE